ncbi:MAG: hypothetical protein Q7T49_03025 [bacterium]|nr:hypothetical protein [bacterium]
MDSHYDLLKAVVPEHLLQKIAGMVQQDQDAMYHLDMMALEVRARVLGCIKVFGPIEGLD